MKVQGEDKAFKCTICDKRFTTKHYLTKHLAKGQRTQLRYACMWAPLRGGSLSRSTSEESVVCDRRLNCQHTGRCFKNFPFWRKYFKRCSKLTQKYYYSNEWGSSWCWWTRTSNIILLGVVSSLTFTIFIFFAVAILEWLRWMISPIQHIS